MRIPPELQSRIDAYWEGYRKEHPRVQTNALEHQLNSFTKVLKQDEDGRYIAHQSQRMRLPYPELQADPRIKWVDDQGNEVRIEAIESARSRYIAEPQPEAPPAPGGDSVAASAARFAELDSAIFASKPAPANPGIDDETDTLIAHRLTDERAKGVGIRNLGGAQHIFQVNNVEYEPLAMCGSVDAANKIAKMLTAEFGERAGGEFGVVSHGRNIYVMSPANMIDIRAAAESEKGLPKGMKIH